MACKGGGAGGSLTQKAEAMVRGRRIEGRTTRVNMTGSRKEGRTPRGASRIGRAPTPPIPPGKYKLMSQGRVAPRKGALAMHIALGNLPRIDNTKTYTLFYKGKPLPGTYRKPAEARRAAEAHWGKHYKDKD